MIKFGNESNNLSELAAVPGTSSYVPPNQKKSSAEVTKHQDNPSDVSDA